MLPLEMPYSIQAAGQGASASGDLTPMRTRCTDHSDVGVLIAVLSVYQIHLAVSSKHVAQAFVVAHPALLRNS